MLKLFFHKIYCKAKSNFCLFFNLVWKEKCYGCGKTEKLNKYGFCQECEKKIVLYKNKDNLYWHSAVYEGPVKNAIHNFKYNKKKFYGRKLAFFVYDTICENFPDFDFIVPVPLYWKKEFLRGFNQSAIISVYLSKLFRKPVLLDIARRVKDTLPQVDLDKKMRKENVSNCFRIKKVDMVKGKRVVIFDDVFTTGATTEELKKLLRKAGAKKVIILTIAKTIY